MNPRKLIREIERRLGDLLISIEPTRGGHLCLHLACGRRVFASATPSCPYALEHVLGDVRRAINHHKDHV